jgi:hypothetical protein
LRTHHFAFLRTFNLRDSAAGGFFSVTVAGFEASDFVGFFWDGGLVLVALTCEKLFDVSAEFLVGHRGGLGGWFKPQPQAATVTHLALRCTSRLEEGRPRSVD